MIQTAWDAMCGALLGVAVAGHGGTAGRVHTLSDEGPPEPILTGRICTPVRRGIPPGWLTYNERGDLIGQAHPKSKISDEAADEIALLHTVEGVSYKQLALRFRISKACVRDIVKGRRRAQFIARATPARDGSQSRGHLAAISSHPS